MSIAGSEEFVAWFKLASTWFHMIRRCYDPKASGYRHYGGRGITVCERWLGPDGLSNFFADMGPKPAKGMSLDRIDNDGNYEPGNCRWATQSEQCLNKRGSAPNPHYDRLLGMPLKEAAHRLGLNPSALGKRLKKMTVEAALSMARGQSQRGSRNGHAKFTEADIIVIRSRVTAGESISAVARSYGVVRTAIQKIVQRKAWAHVP